MDVGGLFLVLVMCFGYFAVKERAFWNMRRSIEPIATPLSRALLQLVGMAGAIYLGLGLLASFLDLEMPDRVKALGFGLDPLAVFAIVLALIQPYTIRFGYFIKKKIL